jgi:hypothetical protein
LSRPVAITLAMIASDGTEARSMLGTLLEAFKLVRDCWPKRWSNVQVTFLVKEMGGWTVSCRATRSDLLLVTVTDASGQLIASMEGPNTLDGEVRQGCNLQGMSPGWFVDCFRMARCYREFERTGDVEPSGHFNYFRTRTVYRWECLEEDERLARESAEEAEAA